MHERQYMISSGLLIIYTASHSIDPGLAAYVLYTHLFPSLFVLLFSLFIDFFTVEKEEENQDESQPYIDNESVAFSKLLTNITEKLGPGCVPEIQHFLMNIRCPDGTPLFNYETLYDRKTIDGLLIPLVTSNFCTPRDLDILIHILNGLKREDLLPLISAYVPKVTVGKPFVRPSGDGMFLIRVVLSEAIKRIDLGIVSAIKHDLCTCFGIQQRPFLIHYIGWQCTPVILHFQVPNACMQLVEEGLHNSIYQLNGNGIDCIKLDINSTTFSIPMT